MDSVAAGRWGTWGTGGTVGGGGGNASASSLTSFGRDEKILTAAAAGLGASVLAALGLWAGVSLRCDAETVVDKSSYEDSFEYKLKRSFSSNLGVIAGIGFDYITLYIMYSIGSDKKIYSIRPIGNIMVPGKLSSDFTEHIERILEEQYGQTATSIDVKKNGDDKYTATFVFGDKQTANSLFGM